MNYEERVAEIERVWQPVFNPFTKDDPTYQEQIRKRQYALLLLEKIWKHDSEYISYTQLSAPFNCNVTVNEYIAYFCGAVQKLLKAQFYIETDMGDLILDNKMVLDMMKKEQYKYREKDILFRFLITKGESC